MTEEEKQVKPRKPHTPNLDAVIGAVKRGEYNERISELLEAVSEINKQRQEDVLKMVREVFGPGAEVHWAENEITSVEQTGPVEEKPNLFVNRARASEQASIAKMPVGVPGSVPLPGPYKISPEDGNAYRADSPVSPTGSLWITDIHGGHRAQITEDMWRSWDLVVPGDGIEEIADVEVMPELDEVERRMAAESDQVEPTTQVEPTQSQVPVDIERRGAQISGLHSSDISG